MKHLKLKVLPALLIAASLQAHAQLPTGMTVVNGQATAQTNGKQLTVTNSANTILDWRSFSIGADSAVRFVQPSSTSSVLNRVSGTDPSNILGSLSSNGRVWLLNPNGVLFGAGARVDVASLVTSTLNISNSDWLAGRNVFSGTGTGSIVNQGEIRSATGGRVALIASGVSNEGLISAPDGQIILAAGSSVELVDTGAPNLAVKLTAPTGQAVNLGSLSAGRIDVMAAAVNQQGIVEAQTLVLQADGRLTLGSGSRTSADGTLGGNIKLLGQTIDLQDGSTVSANGTNGGGTVLVGGGAQGQDASVPNAQGVYFAPGASISADALTSGDGGHIVLWADQATRAYGALSAHAGAQSGNGGLIETSGHWLDARPASLNVQAPRGRAGTWLLDPYNITISDAVSDANFDASFTATGNSATISSNTIGAALNAGSNVTISTSSGGAQAGNITLTGVNLYVGPSVGVTLTLNAAADITADNTVISNAYYAPLTVIFNAGLTTAGAVSLNNTTIDAGTTGAGSIALNGSGHLGLPDGVKLAGTTLSTSSGNITINGSTGEAGGRGVALDPGTTGNYLSGGFITINGTSTAGTGVQMKAAQVTAASQVSITGTGSGNGVEISYYGSNSPLQLSGNNVTLNGTSTGTNHGVLIDFTGAISGGIPLSASAAGGTAMQITGTNNSGGLEAVALLGSSQDPMFSVGTAGIALNATGGGMLLNYVFTSGTTAGFNATSSSTLVIDNSYITTDSQKRIGLHAQDITLEGQTTLYAGATTGAAFTVNGADGVGPAASFDNQAGSGAIQLNSGGSYFTLYVNDATNSATFNLGGIAYDYQRYGALSGPVAGDTGNGIISYQSHTATLNGSVIPRAYDGTTTANVSNAYYSTAVSGDYAVGSMSYTADYADKNAGTGKLVTVNMTLSPAFYDAGNHPVYGYDVTNTLTGDINKATLMGTVTGANKVYNANTTAGVSVTNVNGLVGSETIALSATGTFADKNVGTNKIITAGYALADGTNGGLASNYQFQPPAEAITANITPATISFTATAANRVYNATTNATLSNIVLTPLGSDQLTLNAGSAQFSDKNVGTGKTVFTTGYSLSGTDAGNYTLQSPTGLTANITAAPISFTATAQNKSYDGTTAATLSGLTFTPLGSDQLTLNTGAAAFADKNAGTGKTVNLTGYSISGSDAGNYTFTAPTLTANITKAVLTGTVSITNKVYDATTTAGVSVSNVSGLIGSETIGVGATGTFADKNVGTGKIVTANYVLSDGSNGGLASNYQLSAASAFTGSITPATLIVTATAANKIYDATSNATLTNVGFTPLGSDQLTLNAGSALFSDKNVGTGKSVFLSGYSLGGADAGNYVLQTPSNLTANITPFAISFTATTQNKVYDGTTAATLGNFTLAALGSDQVTLNNGTATFADKNVGSAKSITATGFSLGGTDAGNYTLSAPTTLVADITPAQLRGVVTGTNKVYDGTTTATVGVSGLAGLVGSETITVAGLGNFSDKNVGTAKSINATYQLGNGTNGGLASNYTFLPSGSAITADITPATLTYVADAALMQTGAPFPMFTGTITGFVGGDNAGNSLSNAGSYQAGVSTSTAAGIYAINGTGASAQNYVFVQAGSNATALTIAGGGPAVEQAQAAAVPINNVQPVSAPPSNPISTGIIDLTPPPLAPLPGGSSSFEALPLGDMSQQQVADALGARSLAMQAVLGGGLSQVKSNPAVADVAPCKSLKEAATGLCLVTEALKLEARGQGVVQQAAAPAPAPAPGAAPVIVAQAAAPIAPAPLPPLFASRKVKNAALPEIRRKLAVLIGESQYADKTIPSLGNAGSDAHAVAETLSSQLGYETLVLDNPSKELIISTLNRLALETGEQDSVVIYYAGHGAQVDATGQGYWLPANADASQAKTWLSNADIARLVHQVGAHQVALISDSCYSGALVGGAKIRGVSGTVNPADLLSRRAAVVMSSGGNEPVFDAGRGGHSLFAWSLMRNLEQVKGWQLGGNLFERVRFSVARELPQRPQYGTAQGSVEGGDYFFETRQFDLASL